MRNKVYILFSLLILASFVLGACAPAPAPTPETIIQTVVVEKEGETVVQTVEVEVTPVPEEVQGPDHLCHRLLR
jgi:predicted S18 family serine protease